MPNDDHEVRALPSVLDRLVDRDPTSTHDMMLTRARSAREFRFQVLRDLEHLMNARNPFFDVAADFPEVARSVISYGLPDISSLYLTRTKDQQDLRQAIESAIATFEPRLDKIKVTAIPIETGVISIDDQKSDRRITAAMRFRVDAVLLIDPSPEAIAFDIDMSVESRNCEVKERS